MVDRGLLHTLSRSQLLASAWAICVLAYAGWEILDQSTDFNALVVAIGVLQFGLAIVGLGRPAGVGRLRWPLLRRDGAIVALLAVVPAFVAAEVWPRVAVQSARWHDAPIGIGSAELFWGLYGIPAAIMIFSLAVTLCRVRTGIAVGLAATGAILVLVELYASSSPASVSPPEPTIIGLVMAGVLLGWLSVSALVSPWVRMAMATVMIMVSPVAAVGSS